MIVFTCFVDYCLGAGDRARLSEKHVRLSFLSCWLVIIIMVILISIDLVHGILSCLRLPERCRAVGAARLRKNAASSVAAAKRIAETEPRHVDIGISWM